MFTCQETDLTTTADAAVSLARYAGSMLGNSHCIKCIICDDKHIFARDIAVVLQNINTKHPVTQLIFDCCEEYHDKYGCGTKSLLYLIGQWIQIGIKLLQQGISAHSITSTLRSTIENCIQYVDTLAFSVDEFLEPSSNQTPFVGYHSENNSTNILSNSYPPDLFQPKTNFHIPPDISWFFQDTSDEGSVLEDFKDPSQTNNSDPKSQFLEFPEKINLENNITSEGGDSDGDNCGGGCDDDDFNHCFDEISSVADVAKQRNTIKETQCQYFTKNSSVYSPTASGSNLTNYSTSHIPKVSSERENWLQDYLKTKLQKPKIPNSFPHLQCSRYFNYCGNENMNFRHYNKPVTNAEVSKLDDDFKEILISNENKYSHLLRFQNSSDSVNFPDIWQQLKGLIQALCHGAHTEIEDFLMEALKHQNKHLSDQDKVIRLDIKRLHTCCIQGPTIKNSYFVPGVVLPLHQETFCIMQDKPHTVLLLNGDVSYNSHHIGYKKLAVVKEECSYDEFISKTVSEKDRWLEQVQWIIKKLNVTIVIARGQVDDQLKTMLSSHHILVFDSVGHTTMRTLAYNTDPIVYVIDATIENTISGVTVNVLNSVPQNNTKTFLVLHSNQSEVQTLVLRHGTCAGLDVLEQEFWLCCHRVSSVLRHGKFLAGCGITEMQIAKYLQTRSDALKLQDGSVSSIGDLTQAEILCELAGSFQNYQNMVRLNSGSVTPQTQSEIHWRHSPASKYYALDDLWSKVQGWKRGIQLVSILLHTDTHIIIG